MKIFSYVVIALALVTIVFNATRIDFNNPLQGDSTIALIGIVASFCAIIIVALYQLAKKVDENTK